MTRIPDAEYMRTAPRVVLLNEGVGLMNTNALPPCSGLHFHLILRRSPIYAGCSKQIRNPCGHRSYKSVAMGMMGNARYRGSASAFLTNFRF